MGCGAAQRGRWEPSREGRRKAFLVPTGRGRAATAHPAAETGVAGRGRLGRGPSKGTAEGFRGEARRGQPLRSGRLDHSRGLKPQGWSCGGGGGWEGWGCGSRNAPWGSGSREGPGAGVQVCRPQRPSLTPSSSSPASEAVRRKLSNVITWKYPHYPQCSGVRYHSGRACTRVVTRGPPPASASPSVAAPPPCPAERCTHPMGGEGREVRRAESEGTPGPSGKVPCVGGICSVCTALLGDECHSFTGVLQAPAPGPRLTDHGGITRAPEGRTSLPSVLQEVPQSGDGEPMTLKGSGRRAIIAEGGFGLFMLPRALSLPTQLSKNITLQGPSSYLTGSSRLKSDKIGDRLLPKVHAEWPTVKEFWGC